MRIKNISNYDYDNTLLSRKIYDYHKKEDVTKSSGILVNDAHALYRSNEKDNYSITTCSNFNPVNGGTFILNDWKNTIVEQFSSSSFNNVDNNSITYKNVTEYNEGLLGSNGHIISTFRTDDDYWYDTYGLIKINYGHKRGKLLSKEIYNTENLIVKKEENNYIEDPRKTGAVTWFKLFQHGTISGSIPTALGMPVPLNQIFEVSGITHNVK